MPNQHGPISRTGKLASCMNHLQHGSTAVSLFIKDENADDFLALLENAFEQHQPAFNHDAALVTRAIKNHWILLRRERTLNTLETALHDRKPEYPTWLLTDLHELNLFDRYKNRGRPLLYAQFQRPPNHSETARDEQRWQNQLAREKQKPALDLERFALAKEKENVRFELAKHKRKLSNKPPRRKPRNERRKPIQTSVPPGPSTLS